MGEILAVCISKKKGTKKINIKSGFLVPNHGLEGDAHAGAWSRQVSLLAVESVAKVQAQGLEVGLGDFAENFLTQGMDLLALPLGTKLKLGPEAVVEVTQIGKECHQRCEIYYLTGDCVMPREGIFGVVRKGGPVKVGDPVFVLEEPEERSNNVSRRNLG